MDSLINAFFEILPPPPNEFCNSQLPSVAQPAPSNDSLSSLFPKMKLKLSLKRFLSLSPSSSSSELHHLAPPAPSSLLLPLTLPSRTNFHPLPTSSSAPPKSPLAFPATFFTPTLPQPQNSEASSSSSNEPSRSSHQHASSSSSPPTPNPNSNPNGSPSQPTLSDALWQSHFSLSLAHLHTTLPLFFPPNPPPQFPPEIYHPHITLSLPIPLGGLEEIHGLTVYGLVFGGARRSLSLLLSDMWVRVERCTILPPGSTGKELEEDSNAGGEGKVEGLGGELDGGEGGGEGAGLVGGYKKEGSFGSINKARLDRKVRLRVKVGGKLRLPSLEGGLLGGGEGIEREWTISNLYTFSPLTALITHHQVETIHPAPGEGLSGWVTSWRGGGGGKRAAAAATAEGQGCASARRVEVEERGAGRKGVC
ncbi:hypothetical protein BDY24DRAFT_416224 [Mrakia frigida]|uniref:uncharacterized protein n=1 Tax=Mrakia frigida TaxID=29902 RepID=UPI003FCC0E03